MPTSGRDEKLLLILEAYADGECDATERAVAEKALREHVWAREYVDQARADRRAFTGAHETAVARWDVTAAVAARLADAPPPTWPQPVRRRRAKPTSPVSWPGVLAGLALTCVIAAMVFPVFAKSRAKARTTSCLSNIRQIATALASYAEDNHDTLPPSHDWQARVMPYLRNDQILVCPSSSADRGKGDGHYAMNPKLSEANVEDIEKPDETILIYEVDADGRPTLRHNGGMNLGYADGHVKWHRGVPDGLARTTGFAPPTKGYGLAEELKIAYVASAEVWVDDIHSALLSAEETVSAQDGFVLVSRVQATEHPYTAEIVCRVPRERIGDAIDHVGSLGWVAGREIAGEDVTAQYLDAQWGVADAAERISSAAPRAADPAAPRADRETARKTVDAARDAQRTAERQRREMDSQTVLSTISITLTQRGARPPVDHSGLRGTLRKAGEASVTALGFTTRVLIWTLAFCWVWGPPAWWWRRRSHRRQEAR